MQRWDSRTIWIVCHMLNTNSVCQLHSAIRPCASSNVWSSWNSPQMSCRTHCTREIWLDRVFWDGDSISSSRQSICCTWDTRTISMRWRPHWMACCDHCSYDSRTLIGIQNLNCIRCTKCRLQILSRERQAMERTHSICSHFSNHSFQCPANDDDNHGPCSLWMGEESVGMFS